MFTCLSTFTFVQRYHNVTPKKPRANTELVGLALRSKARLRIVYLLFALPCILLVKPSRAVPRLGTPHTAHRAMMLFSAAGEVGQTQEGSDATRSKTEARNESPYRRVRQGRTSDSDRIQHFFFHFEDPSFEWERLVVAIFWRTMAHLNCVPPFSALLSWSCLSFY
jgi:hypothetical protein